MGSGKTSIGKRLASVLKYHFVDSDELVVQKAGLPLKKLIHEHGEKAFRELEAEVLKDFSQKNHYVISTGGGVILNSKNQELLPRLGTVVWLHACAETLYERAQRNLANRPLLEVEHPRRTFHQLLAARLLIYDAISDIKINTTTLSYSQTIDKIVKALEQHGSQLAS